MTLPPAPDRWTIELANAERREAIEAFGFTDRQARFLLQVLLHSGVFVERQYCRFAGIAHGQKSTNFINGLVERRYATPVVTGKLHRGRMFHVHYKPLWTAVGEPDSRFRKAAPLGRMIERVMLLDVVLDDTAQTWLGPAFDKRRFFVRRLDDRLSSDEYPRRLFGDGPAKCARLFPDKLPIGVQPYAGDPHVFVYLVTRPSPMDFRQFLLRHTALLQALHRWTIRLVIPRQFSAARSAYLHAAREHLAAPIPSSTVESLQALFEQRQRLVPPTAEAPNTRRQGDDRGFRAPRFQALYRQWLDDPANTLYLARSPLLADAMERQNGRVETVELSRQYLHLSPLVGVA